MEYPNWFSVTAENNFKELLIELSNKKIRCLQIGAYTGDASKWMADNILLQDGSILFDVDTWKGSNEEIHLDFDWKDVRKTYDEKVFQYLFKKVVPYRVSSDTFFESKWNTKDFDFIYIDGDHTAIQVLKDGINAFKSLKIGGIIAFDDFAWKSGKGKFFDPLPGIRSFYDIHESYVNVIKQNGQLWVKKIGEPNAN